LNACGDAVVAAVVGLDQLGVVQPRGYQRHRSDPRVAGGVDRCVARACADGHGADPFGVDAVERGQEAHSGVDVGGLLVRVLQITDDALALAVTGEVEGQRGQSLGSEPSRVQAGHLLLDRGPGAGDDHGRSRVGCVDGSVEVADQDVGAGGEPDAFGGEGGGHTCSFRAA